jgi:hypothetical protein
MIHYEKYNQHVHIEICKFITGDNTINLHYLYMHLLAIFLAEINLWVP